MRTVCLGIRTVHIVDRLRNNDPLMPFTSKHSPVDVVAKRAQWLRHRETDAASDVAQSVATPQPVCARIVCEHKSKGGSSKCVRLVRTDRISKLHVLSQSAKVAITSPVAEHTMWSVGCSPRMNRSGSSPGLSAALLSARRLCECRTTAMAGTYHRRDGSARARWSPDADRPLAAHSG